MEETMEFLQGLAEYGIKYVIFLCIAVAGVLAGKWIRVKKNGKKVVD